MGQLFEELKRRNVFRVGIAYVVAAWLILQVIDLVLDAVPAPAWVMQVFLLAAAVGLPIALLFAWAFEMTPEGVVREKDVDRSVSITHRTGRKLDYIIIAVLISAVGLLLVDKFVLQESADVSVVDKSVAVLPFVAMSSGPDDEYFADGLTEEILNALAQLPELLVSARTSAFYFKGKDIPIGEIAAKLGVAHIVEGSVRRDGDQLRVTAQLIRASDGFHLWSNTYDRPATSGLVVQSDIAEKVAASLDIVLDEGRLASMRAIGVRDPEAFVAYQKGRELYYLAHGDEDRQAILERANAYFDRAIELSPDFSAAYEEHADYYAHILMDSSSGISTSVSLRDAQDRLVQDLENARRYAPSEARSLSIAFDLAFLLGDWGKLSSIHDELVRNEGCEMPSWLDMFAFPYGLTEETVPLIRRRIGCDPMDYGGWYKMILAAIWMDDDAHVVAIATEGIDTVAHVRIREMLVVAMIAAGHFDDARRTIDQHIHDDRRELSLRLRLAAAQGNADEAKQRLETLLARDDESAQTLVEIAIAGNRDLANQTAHEIDAKRYGYLRLGTAVTLCFCGAPFDLDATPNYARMIGDANFSWPPASPIDWPLKDW